MTEMMDDLWLQSMGIPISHTQQYYVGESEIAHLYVYTCCFCDAQIKGIKKYGEHLYQCKQTEKDTTP